MSAWRKAHNTSDSAEALRQARIRLVQEQTRRAKIEADEKEGRLIDAREVVASMTRCTSIAKGEFLKLASDLPPQLEGLTAAQIQPILRSAIIEILTRLSDETSALYQA
jgi:hypothetical protein